MYVESLALKDFRNYASLDLKLDPGTNILWGDNAQGKTNILEALYLCATSKSHRGSRDHEMIRFGCSECHIRSILHKENVRHRIDLHLRRGKAKGIALEGSPIRRSGQLFGMLNIVCFSPEDLSMVKNGPALRRHFIDMELCQLKGVYLHDLSSYNKAVNQTNSLLKQIANDRTLADTLDVWDQQLVRYGKGLIGERKKFIEFLGQLAAPIHARISGGREELKLMYAPSVSEEEFEQKLFLLRDSDLRTKSTSAGPHRDDMIFQINGTDVRKFGSQGQQRTAALSLKLAEIELMKRQTGDKPVLLLDDVLSELDSRRQKDLLDSISDVQTIITCTGIDEFLERNVDIGSMHRVVNGTVD